MTLHFQFRLLLLPSFETGGATVPLCTELTVPTVPQAPAHYETGLGELLRESYVSLRSACVLCSRSSAGRASACAGCARRQM